MKPKTALSRSPQRGQANVRLVLVIAMLVGGAGATYLALRSDAPEPPRVAAKQSPAANLNARARAAMKKKLSHSSRSLAVGMIDPAPFMQQIEAIEAILLGEGDLSSADGEQVSKQLQSLADKVAKARPATFAKFAQKRLRGAARKIAEINGDEGDPPKKPALGALWLGTRTGVFRPAKWKNPPPPRPEAKLPARQPGGAEDDPPAAE